MAKLLGFSGCFMVQFKKTNIKPMNNKNYLVIGGSKGIGLETACELTQAGANVWVAARHLTDELADLGVSFQAIDVTQAFVLSNLPAVLHGVVYCPLKY